jgi:hypothetical protein
MKVAFFRGTHPGLPGLFCVVVKWWLRGDFSHAELVFGEPNEQGQSLCWSSTFLDKGVRSKLQDISTDEWVVVDLPTNDFVEDAALAWFRQHEGQPYDVRALLGFVFRRVPQTKKRWFCSESVAAALGFHQSWRLDPVTFFTVINRMAKR